VAAEGLDAAGFGGDANSADMRMLSSSGMGWREGRRGGAFVFTGVFVTCDFDTVEACAWAAEGEGDGDKDDATDSDAGVMNDVEAEDVEGVSARIGAGTDVGAALDAWTGVIEVVIAEITATGAWTDTGVPARELLGGSGRVMHGAGLGEGMVRRLSREKRIRRLVLLVVVVCLGRVGTEDVDVEAIGAE
jgi:hypothetical protein